MFLDSKILVFKVILGHPTVLFRSDVIRSHDDSHKREQMEYLREYTFYLMNGLN